MSKIKIHPTAIIDSSAQIEEGVEIGPFCIIGEKVKIGQDTTIQSNAVIEHAEIGANCKIFHFVSIGLPPQDTKYHNEETKVIIGRNNTIREYTSFHRASVGGDGITSLKDNNYLMAYVHIAHDCKLGSHITMANVATLAGHVHVHDHAVIGGLAALHQFTRVGAYAMVGGFSGIGKDVLPYMLASGSRAELYGVNVIGLKRHGFSDDIINDIKECHKIIFRSNLTLNEAVQEIREKIKMSKEIELLLDFIDKNGRGIMR
jgi:UDP-N-acetylglucosamine acyltransferase